MADAIEAVHDELGRRRLCDTPLTAALSAAPAENREAPDYRFMPLIERLERIFQVRLGHDRELAATVCERFLSPIFALARVYDDTLPALARLRRAGIRTAIVSNAPWGSPPDLWRRELEHLGLAGAVDAVILCGDVGWRKPAPEFSAPLCIACCRPSECVFVGDDLRGTSREAHRSACAPS